MKKIENAGEDTVKIFDKVRNATSIPNWVAFTLLSNNEQKELYKINKFNEASVHVIEDRLGDHVDISIIINEDILDQLEEKQKEMVFDECLTAVSVNDKDVVSLKKPTFCTYFGMLEKYGHDTTIVLHESIKSLFDSKKEKEDQAKAEKNTKKSKSK